MVTLRQKAENPSNITGARVWIGGLDWNRTSDTRIFNPSHNVKFISAKLKKCNNFSQLVALLNQLYRTEFRTFVAEPTQSPYDFLK